LSSFAARWSQSSAALIKKRDLGSANTRRAPIPRGSSAKPRAGARHVSLGRSSALYSHGSVHWRGLKGGHAPRRDHHEIYCNFLPLEAKKEAVSLIDIEGSKEVLGGLLEVFDAPIWVLPVLEYGR
jgi:hypothetical protein